MRRLLIALLLLPNLVNAQLTISNVRSYILSKTQAQIRPIDIRNVGYITAQYARQADSTAAIAVGWGNHSGLYLPIAGGSLTGTAGAGFIGIPPQSSKPGAPTTSALKLYSSSTGQLGVLQSSGFAALLDFSALTNDRTIGFPNQAGTVLLSAGDQSISGIKTFSGTLRSTGSIVNSSTSSAFFYNTTDEATNYERGYAKWNSNTFEVGTEIGGTGTNRPIRVAAGSTTLALTISNTSPRYLFGGTSGANDQHIIATNGTYSTGGNIYYNSFSAYPTLNPSGTATYTAYYASPLPGGSSTGERKLIDLGTNTGSVGALATHTSRFKVLFDGTTTIVGNVTAAQFRLSASNTAPLSATDTGTAGEIRITPGFIYYCTATNTWVRSAFSTW